MSQQNSRGSKEALSKSDLTSSFYQSMALAAAFAARNGLSSPPASAAVPSFHPAAMYPYANPYGLPIQNNCFLPGSSAATSAFPSLWRPNASALTNDYLLAMAGNLHNFRAGMSNEQQRQQPQHSPTNRRNVANVTSGNNENNAEESFEEMLRKISQMPNKSNASSADADTPMNALKQTESNRSSQENQSPTSSQKLATLAHIASCISSNENPEPDTTSTAAAASTDGLRNSPSRVSSAQKRKVDVEQDEVSSTSDNFVSKRCKTSDVSPNNKSKRATTIADNHHQNRKIFDQSTSPFKNVDPTLLNASAVAWAALSNQLLLAASLQRSGEELKNKDPKLQGSSGSHVAASGATTCSKSFRSSISPATTKNRMSANVPRDQEKMKKSQNSESRKQISAVIDHLTSRQKQMIKSSKVKNDTASSDDVPVLDLSVKGFDITKELDIKKDQSHHSDCDKNILRTSSRSSRTADHAPDNFQHDDAIVEPMAVPMLNGWRRQTCVRTISATGVRGDVIYYAPCGRRLGSYAEVVRYLAKNKIKNLSRQNFSFSSKVVVGEFLHVKFENGKNTVALLNEKEVKSTILRLQNSLKEDLTFEDLQSNSSIRLRSSTCSKNIDNNEVKQRSENRKRGRPPLSAITSFAKPEASLSAIVNAEKNKRGRPRSIDNLTMSEIQKGVNQHVLPRTVENPSSVTKHDLLKTYEQLRHIYQKPDPIPDLKLLKIPTDDLDFKNSAALKGLKRIENLYLDSQSFADLLMVVEFVRNFGPVLKISQEDIPDIDSLQAGLFNVKRHSKATLKLAKILLTLVLEYPGIPSGRKSRMKTGQSYRDVAVDYMNMSEMMQLFLDSRCAQGRALAIPLQDNCFEALRPSDKISILAYMCNELLYCRNVVREIETNVDVLSKCRSDKWLMENKRKQLRTMRDSTSNKTAIKSKNEIDDDNSALISEAEKMVEDNDEDETLDKLKQRILIENESLTNEVTDLTEEEVDERMNDLEKNIACTNSKVKEAVTKVRTLPLGQDRYFRLYWSLPSSSTSGILVESLESQIPRDQSSNLSIPIEISRMIKNDSISNDVVQCLEFLLDTVCKSRSGKIVAEKLRAENAAVAIPNDDRNGWYRIGDKADLLELEKTLNCRGIREKLLHRVLTYKFERQPNDQLFKKQEFLTTCFDVKSEFETQTAANLAKMHKVYARLHNLEEKIFIAGINVKSAKAPSSPDDSTTNDLDLHCRKFVNSLRKKAARKSTNQTATPSSPSKRGRRRKNSTNRSEADKETDRFSTSSDFSDNEDNDCDSIFDFNFEIEDSASNEKEIDKNGILSAMSRDLEYLTDIVRSKLFELERNVEQRYLQPGFQAKSMAASASSENDDTNIATEKSNHPNVADARKRWLETLESAKSSAQFSLCLDFLDKNICWERSAMKAMCQICRRGDNDSQLLLCDGCDLGYHTYCFKPEMSCIPDTDWFCPECVSQATRRPCCLLCCRQTSRPMIMCYECDRPFHCDCASESEKLEPDQKNWLCRGCESLSKDKGANNDQNKKLRKKSQKDSVVDVSKRENKNSKTKMKGRRRSSVELNSTKNDSLHFTEICGIIMADLDTHKDAWPFRNAVDPKMCPLYGKIIKKPMDLSLVQEKLAANKYKNADDFVADMKLMFNNCKIFNEDDSAVGKSGRSLKKFFIKRWRELNEISSVT